MSSAGALGGRRSPVRPPARPMGSPSTGPSLPVRGGQGVWPGWMDVCLALERSRVPCPQPCPSALQGSLPWPPLSVVYICRTSDAPDAGRASASWGPWLGAPLTRLPGVPPALWLLQTQGRLLHHSLGPLGTYVCAQTPTPHTDGARGPGHGTRRSKGCSRKLGVSRRARSSGCWLGSRLTSPARCRRRRGALHLEELCLQSLTRRRGHGRGCPDRRACPRPVTAETACCRLGA